MIDESHRILNPILCGGAGVNVDPKKKVLVVLLKCREAFSCLILKSCLGDPIWRPWLVLQGLDLDTAFSKDDVAVATLFI